MAESLRQSLDRPAAPPLWVRLVGASSTLQGKRAI